MPDRYQHDVHHEERVVHELKEQLRETARQLKTFISESSSSHKAAGDGSQMSEMHDYESMVRHGQLDHRDVARLVDQKKRQVVHMRQRLQNDTNLEKIVALENRLREKSKILIDLRREAHSLHKVQRDQNQALNDAATFNSAMHKKMNELKSSHRVMKGQHLDLKKQYNDLDTKLRDKHRSTSQLEDRVRKLKAALKEVHRNKARSKSLDQKLAKISGHGNMVRERQAESKYAFFIT